MDTRKKLTQSDLSEVRRSYGWTLKNCSKAWGLSPQHLNNVELGKRNLTPKILALYETLVGGTSEQPLVDRIQWSKEEVERRIGSLSGRLGRMPTVSELSRHASWGNAMACYMARSGGLARWARQLGLDVKGHCSGKGWMWEEWVAAELRHQGHEVERRMDVKAPFDLMVGEGCRVDVKVSEQGAHWAFAIRNKLGACDFYVFVCLEDGAPRRVYVMPDGVAPVSMLTITRAGKYERYRNSWGLIDPERQ